MTDPAAAMLTTVHASSRLDICVLGGTGFVGRRLLPYLARQGHTLRVPTRRPVAPGELRVLPDLTILHGDVSNPAFLRACVRGCDAVVNLIGILNEKGRDGSGFRAIHADLVRELLEACRQGGVRKLVQISALQADAEAGASHYLRSKGQAENLIRHCELPAWTVLQPSVIFGPGDSFLNRFATLLRITPVFPLARPDARFAPVHVDDVVAAIDRALTDPDTDGHCYQLCGPEVFSLLAIVRLIARTLRLHRWVFGLPDWLGYLQAAILEWLPGKPFSIDNFRSLKTPSLCSEDGFHELGLQPRSLRLNIERSLRPPG
ncbi:MAG TPA: complex I NDUFA9 subunit family protein [Chromatiales bacterium]|nr:complex I NDUFA9 subunit family protein [Chromatiales bacterium]